MIEVENLSYSYLAPDGRRTSALADISLEVAPGEFLAIVGPSGCGKTTLLNIMVGIEPVQAGSVRILGSAPRAGHPEIGYMLARDCLLPWRKARDNAALALELQGFSRQERRKRAETALGWLGLAHCADSYPAQLSQGMRQRVALARVFAAEPRMIFLDEPFSALDVQTRVLVQDAFLSVWEQHRTTVVLVTHDLAEAVCLADRIVVISAGPGRIKSITEVGLPRPRRALDLRSDPAYHKIYESVWNDLHDEVVRAAHQTDAPRPEE